MGMFDKDKEYGLNLANTFPLREPLIVWDAKIRPETIQTKLGAASVAELLVSRLEDPNEKMLCNTVASAIVDKIRDAESSDFPAVCELQRVKGRFQDDTLVLQYVKDYKP